MMLVSNLDSLYLLRHHITLLLRAWRKDKASSDLHISCMAFVSLLKYQILDWGYKLKRFHWEDGTSEQ